MDSALRDDIYHKLSAYLDGRIDLAEFHNWFIPATWDIDTEPDYVKNCAHRIQLLLAEFSNGDRSEQELRARLQELRLPKDALTPVFPSS